MNLKYLQERVGMLGAKSIQIYPGNIMSLDDAFPVFVIQDDQDTNRQLQMFGNNFSGTFTAFLRTDKNQGRKSGERIVFYHSADNSSLKMQESASHPINGNVPSNLDELKKQWQQEWMREHQQQLLIQQIQDLKNEIAEQRKPEARLVTIITELSNHMNWGLFKKQDNPAPSLIQGVTHPQQEAPSKIIHTMDNLTESQQDQLEEAWATIYAHLGFDTLLKVAAALERDPSLANKLNMFL